MKKSLLLLTFMLTSLFSFNLNETKHENILTQQIATYLNSHVRKVDPITYLKEAKAKNNDVVVDLLIDNNAKEMEYFKKRNNYNSLKETIRNRMLDNFCHKNLFKKVLSFNVGFKFNYILADIKNNEEIKKIFSIKINKNDCKKL